MMNPGDGVEGSLYFCKYNEPPTPSPGFISGQGRNSSPTEKYAIGKKGLSVAQPPMIVPVDA